MPVNIKLMPVDEPNCVNPPKFKEPALKPALPTVIVFPEANVGVPFPELYPNMIPPVPVEETMIESLNKSFEL